MASEAYISDQTADGIFLYRGAWDSSQDHETYIHGNDPHTEETKVTDDIGIAKSNSASQSEIGGSNDFEKQKVEESGSPETSINEAEEKTKEKKDNLPVVEEKEGQQDDVLSYESPSNETKEGTEEKTFDLPVAEEMKKEDEDAKTSDLDVSGSDGSKEVESCDRDLPTPLEPAPAVDEAELVKSIYNSEPSNEPDTKLVDISEPSNEPVTKLADISEPSNEPVTKLADISEPSNGPDTKLADTSESSNEPDTKLADTSESSNEPDTKLADISESSNEPDKKLGDISEPSNETETKLVDISEPSNVPDAMLVDVSEPSNEPEIKLADISEPSNDKPVDLLDASVIQKLEAEVGRTTEISESIIEKNSEQLKDTSDDPISASESDIKPEGQISIPVAADLARRDTGEVGTETFDARKNLDTSTGEKIFADVVEAGPGSSTKEPSAIDTVKRETETDSFTDEKNDVQENAAADVWDAVTTDTAEVSEAKENGDGAVFDAIQKAAADPHIDEAEETKKDDNASSKVEASLKDVAVDDFLSNPSSSIGMANSTISDPEIAEGFLKSVLKVEDKREEGFVETDELHPSAMKKILDVGGSNSIKEDTETISEKEKAPEHAENDIAEQKEERLENNITLAQNSRDDVEARTNETDTAVTKSVHKTENAELLVKQEDPRETSVDNSMNEETEKDGSKNTDAQNFVEPSREGDDSKTDVESLKTEVSAKLSHKQSNSIVSKVKQSIVKVKKAITGKRPTPKATSTESKD